MYYSVTHSSIREIKNGLAPTTFIGSSSFTANAPDAVLPKSRPSPQSRKSDVLKPPATASANAAALPAPAAQPRTYKLNKSKIRKKLDAFFQLEASRSFCAFYSISFPASLPDDDAYTLFNLWQTRCRQTYDLRSFLWIAERQKNGTIHFHMLTNTRMPIREVNQFMRVALMKYVHRFSWDISKVIKYNGIDVDNVWYPKKRKGNNATQRRTRDDAGRYLSKYITKYVSKNNDTFSRLAWHASRDLAALFTAQNFDRCEVVPLLSYFESTKTDWIAFPGEYVNVYIHPSGCSLHAYLQLRQINEIVYASMHQEDD